MQFAQNYLNAERPRPSVFGQFVPSGFTGNDSSAGWLQVPPSQMPWGIPMADQPTIVRFTAESSSSMKSSEMCAYGFTQAKRKCDSEETLLPAKQHITEEKMAAHLSQLHISPDYTPPQELEPREDQQQQLKRLVLCEELRKLKQEPILPSSLLSRLEKPNMALVLWEPPAGSIDPLLSREGRGQTEEDNNNTSVVDLNSISTPGFPASEDSMMDL
ncbi:hypothetical protein B7P43_G15515 [Cryptotermes secundus]|uniref:Uncharacterized protein n=1 Tax=Cryptotermes secundus TaxID=105785 RepID=A0A2J7R9E7_9NEOP|nr:uncharacterized protein LOC111862571 [Cryptotermes secundus]XP_033606610.1 uncharacterized protein LOC111862571 [Cryptotermes secundus]PNF37456.1 hypothetical protein B7P43_G15515 [Cryptotermes secundus]PNF37457.1 hypothetical protein B7P43_G15515 [Cryptotermes secundus]